MQVPNTDEVAPENPKEPEDSGASNSTVEDVDDDGATAYDGNSETVDRSGKCSDFSITENSADDGGSEIVDPSGNSLDFAITENSADDGGSEIVDISGKTFEFSITENSEDAGSALYLYKNEFNLLPKSIGSDGKRLRTLKFFGNEINCFSPPSSASSEFGGLEGLECLQVKIPSPEFGGLPLDKLEGLKELELSRVPQKPSTVPMLREIFGLKCLTKLSVCHFSLRYLPPEIGCLNKLEHLDLSFNKMKTLPTEMGNLDALVSLKVANNKLVELPSTLSDLQRLENLDLSNNRLTSLGSLKLDSMQKLQNLNLQYNKLLTNYCQFPSWICCNLERNRKEPLDGNVTSFTGETDVYESPIQKNDESLSRRGFNRSSTSRTIGFWLNSRSSTARRQGRFRRQHRDRQEQLNNSRKCKDMDLSKLLHLKEDGECKSSGNIDLLTSESCSEGASDSMKFDDDCSGKELLSGECQSGNVQENVAYGDMSLKTEDEGSSSDCREGDASSTTPQDVVCEEDEGSSSDSLKSTSNHKGHSDRDHGRSKRDRPPSDTPPPDKDSSKKSRHDEDSANLSWKYSNTSFHSDEDSSNLSWKYCNTSFCGDEDELPDGFYDAGRDRPLLTGYEHNFHLGSREVLLVDRERDEKLDATLISAKALVSNFKLSYGLSEDKDRVDVIQIASLLSHFVSDHFGGSDRSALVEKARYAIASPYEKPFVCTCQTRNNGSVNLSTKSAAESVEDINISDLCEKSLHFIKARRNSIIVPLGTLQLGVCRHRALLFKYLCDRMKPQVPCELVRGYLDFMPHAWNVIIIKGGASQIRMVVDACRPLDIRKETDPEYYCRYIPISRTKVSLSSESSLVPTSSFPSLPFCDGTLKECVRSLIRCKYESAEAVAKVRTLKVYRTSMDEIRNFEYNCLGEVRILGVLKQHPCIVEMYGHRIRSQWVGSEDGGHEHRILQSEILMEYIDGGSLLSYIERLSEAGEKHVPVELALCIAKDVACALGKLHSMHIIHRDIKSDNILIDLERKRADGTPVVKLCDFDRAVPLRSYLHTCCISHVGVPPADACVGTPRWMAPEVYRAMHERNIYGLEVDIWSFGCLLLELLTLQTPYLELSEVEIHDLLERGKRPKLTDDLEAFRSPNEPVLTQAGGELEGTEADLDTLRFLVDLFYQCTEENPQNRPTADKLHELLLEHSNALSDSIT